MRKLNTSTRHHHSFVSNIEPDIHLIFTSAKTTRISHGFRICRKSTGKTQTESLRLLVLPFTQKRWIEKVEMRQKTKTVQSYCNNVRRQRFHNKRALARTRYEAFGATEGFWKRWKRKPRIQISSQEKLFRIQQQQLRVSVQWQAKFLRYLRKEQSFTENRFARIRAGEILPVNAKVERHRQRLQQLLNYYQNINLLSVQERLSFNFDFWM